MDWGSHFLLGGSLPGLDTTDPTLLKSTQGSTRRYISLLPVSIVRMSQRFGQDQCHARLSTGG